MLHMPGVGAATAGKHGEPRQDAAQAAIVLAQFRRIADVEIGRGIQLRMAALGGIRRESAQALAPGAAFAQLRLEMPLTSPREASPPERVARHMRPMLSPVAVSPPTSGASDLDLCRAVCDSIQLRA